MPDVTSYKPGMFCWADLMTTDAKAARSFYEAIFGWQVEDMPIPSGGVYSMARVHGKNSASWSELSPDMRTAKIPPHWNAYFSVADVDASSKKASSLGGKVLAPPFDIAGMGRMSILEDPSGAAFCLWQSQSHPGAQLNNEQGTICWAELHTRNVDACGSFYTRLFDWKPESMNMGDMVYTVFNIDGQANAGMMSMMKNVPSSVPSNWTVYFMVDNCDQTNAKVKALGAQIVVPPNDIPGTGRFALYMDPQGASFGILQPVPRM